MALWADAASGTGSGLRETILTDREIEALIALWGEGDVQDELVGAVRNKVIYKKIAQKLQEHGYHRDWKQCRDKIRNLKTKYKEIRDNNGETGRGKNIVSFSMKWTEFLGIGQLRFHMCSLSRVSLAPVVLLLNLNLTVKKCCALY